MPQQRQDGSELDLRATGMKALETMAVTYPSHRDPGRHHIVRRGGAWSSRTDRAASHTHMERRRRMGKHSRGSGGGHVESTRRGKMCPVRKGRGYYCQWVFRAGLSVIRPSGVEVVRRRSAVSDTVKTGRNINRLIRFQWSGCIGSAPFWLFLYWYRFGAQSTSLVTWLPMACMA
jgi:hypothetical protein